MYIYNEMQERMYKGKLSTFECDLRFCQKIQGTAI